MSRRTSGLGTAFGVLLLVVVAGAVLYWLLAPNAFFAFLGAHGL